MAIIKFLILLSVFFTSLFGEKIRIITNEEPPTNYMYKQEIVGITVDVIKQLLKEMKMQDQEIEFMNWSDAYSIAKKNKNILLFTAGKTSQRLKEGFHFVGPVITKQAVLFKTANNNSKVSSLFDIKEQKLKIGAMRGDWRADYFTHKSFKVQKDANHKESLKKLINGQFDLWATSKIEARFIAKEANIDFAKLDVAYTFKEINSYIMLSKGTPKKVLRQWRRAYSKLQKTDFFDKTAKKWSKILNINLEYSKHKGFFVK